MGRKYLIVVDMQNDFIDGTLGSDEAKAIVPRVVEKIKNWDGEIILTQDIHFESEYEQGNTDESSKIPFHCAVGSDEAKICKPVLDVLEPLPYTRPYTRYEKSKFACTSLGFAGLSGCDCTVIGLCTDICVIANAVILQSSRNRITIDAACCAGSTPENHEAALKVMKAMCMNIENWHDK